MRIEGVACQGDAGELAYRGCADRKEVIAMAAGHPAGQEPFSELRDDRKLRRKQPRS
jgi:hypothetical protein